MAVSGNTLTIASADLAKRKAMMRMLASKGLDALAYAFFVAACVFLVRLAIPDAKAHDGYEKWMQPHRPGLSCCNNHDCEPVEARYNEARQVYQALIEGTWIDIPPHIILDHKRIENVNFDGGYHACWNRTTKELLCFREAEPKS